jgi:hypothetical protein
MKQDIISMLEEIEFIGEQQGFGDIPSFDLINCKVTGTTFALMEGDSLTEKIISVRKKFLDKSSKL